MKISNIFIALALAILFTANTAFAEESHTSADISLLSREQLIGLVHTLRAENTVLKQGMVSTTVKKHHIKLTQELKTGTSGEEVKKLQQILATDPTVYPEGKVTGYFGPLTAQGLSRFQSKYKLDARGTLTPETIELINAILAEQNVTQFIPTGLLSAPGLQNRIKIEIKEHNGKKEYKIEIKCDSSGKGNTCKDSDDKSTDTSDEDDDKDDIDDADGDLEIEIEVTSTNAKIKVEQDDSVKRFIVATTNHDEIIKYIAQKLSISEQTVKLVAEFEDEDENEEDEEDEDDQEDED